MTDRHDLLSAVRELLRDNRRQHDQLCELEKRLGHGAAPATTVWIDMGQAMELSGLSDSRVRALCAENLYDGEDGDGFGQRKGGRWRLAKRQWDAFIYRKRSLRAGASGD